jgi:hypothetical protein
MNLLSDLKWKWKRRFYRKLIYKVFIKPHTEDEVYSHSLVQWLTRDEIKYILERVCYKELDRDWIVDTLTFEGFEIDNFSHPRRYKVRALSLSYLMFLDRIAITWM